MTRQSCRTRRKLDVGLPRFPAFPSSATASIRFHKPETAFSALGFVILASFSLRRSRPPSSCALRPGLVLVLEGVEGASGVHLSSMTARQFMCSRWKQHEPLANYRTLLHALHTRRKRNRLHSLSAPHEHTPWPQCNPS